ncbi:MAG: hypothetical protein GX772_11840 [Alcaligenaceae bacterium]|nr:hypothetical protein [Alcaligenaceae bacterium]
MNTRNKALAIGGGVAAVALIGWFALSSMATNRAEDALYGFLDEYGIRQNVQWRDLSASPFGKVKIDDVSVNVMGKVIATIDKVEIDDFTSDQKRKRISLQASKIADADGYSLLSDWDYLAATGARQQPPASLKVKWDFDLRDNDGTLELGMNQPGAMEGEIKLELENTGVLNNFSQLITESRGTPNFFGASIWQLAMMGALEATGSIRVRSAEARLKDDGYVKRSLALSQRYLQPVSIDEKDPSKARKKEFEKRLDENLAACREEASTTFRSINKGAASCKAFSEFLGGKSSSLKLTSKPARPVSLSMLMENSRSPEQLLLLLQPQLD